MVIRYTDILTAISTISDAEGIGVTVTESAKGGLIAGVGCFAGGVLGGPVGLAVGGAVGGCVAAYLSQGKFKPASEIVAEMPEDKRKELAEAVRRILGNAEVSDAMEMVALVQGNALLKAKIAQEMVTFISSQMGVQVTQPASLGST